MECVDNVHEMLKKFHGHCPHIPWNPWTLSTHTMESMDNPWTMSMDSMENIHGFHGKCPGCPWNPWTFYRRVQQHRAIVVTSVVWVPIPVRITLQYSFLEINILTTTHHKVFILGP